MKYAPRLNIVLHQPEIPPNTGAVGRTCVAVHAKLWLVRPLGFQLNEKTLRRAGLDYWQHLEWQIVDSWEDLLTYFEPAQPFWYFTRFAERGFTTAEFGRGDCLVFGSETAGLPRRLTADQPEQCLRIPTSQDVRSLNLASAVAVAAYEAVRQLGGLD